MKLQIEGLHKHFLQATGPIKVLDGFSLECASSEFTALIGPSGCGKSTLLNIIAGLVPPDTGQIWLEGHPVVDGRGHVAYLQQKDLLLPWRTVLDNAILGLEIQGLPKGQARAQARVLLRRFGLAGFEQAYPNQLSGGMRQRVALVRTLLLEKPIWLLDEPFGALDAMTRTHMYRYLLQAWQEAQPTVLFVTHDIEEVLVLSDWVVLMTKRPGRIKAILEVTLPQPRRVTAPEFVALKEELLEQLQEERIKEAIHEAT